MVVGNRSLDGIDMAQGVVKLFNSEGFGSSHLTRDSGRHRALLGNLGHRLTRVIRPNASLYPVEKLTPVGPPDRSKGYVIGMCFEER
jgi:hypothetical protein